MLELATLGPLVTIAVLLLIAGVASYGVTAIVKHFALAYKKAHKDDPEKKGDRPWWWNPSLRVLAVAIGTGVGFALMPTLIGAGFGLVAGVLNTVIYATAKDKVRDLIKRGTDKVE